MIKILHLTTHNEHCGIAKYNEDFVKELDKLEIINHIFPTSPNILKKMRGKEFDDQLTLLINMAKDHDILHMQHEFSFYDPSQFGKIIAAVKNNTKAKVICTFHTAPLYHKDKPNNFVSLRGFLDYRDKLLERRWYKKNLGGIEKLDEIIIHNKFTKQAFINNLNYPSEKIRSMVLPVYNYTSLETTEEDNKIINKTRTELDLKEGDYLLGMVGFLNAVKGHQETVKSLRLLPNNFKLLIIGGIHPGGENDSFLNKLIDIAYEIGVEKRVYVTGYVTDSSMQNLVEMCDSILYPYDKEYFSSSAAINHPIGAGKPIIAYKVKGLTEINDTYEVVRFTQARSYYELAREIEVFAENPQLAATYVVNGRKYYHDFSYTNQAKRLKDIYQELLGITSTTAS